MNTDELPRPVPRAVRIVAIALVLVAVLLLTLGGLTTSFKAGMTDPVWPTEPWFLLVNGHKYQLETHAGFLMEHTHRAAGWTVGGLASVLAILAWCSAKGMTRGIGLGLIVALLASYGDYHRRMMAVWEARQQNPGSELLLPRNAEMTTAILAGLLAVWCAIHTLSRERGKWVRALSGWLLIAVMIQGLLGGLRVFFDQRLGLASTLGVELSALHGVFAQMVFSTMCCLIILASRPKPEFELPNSDRSRLGPLSLSLVAATFLQLIWAVWVRHAPTPLAQRLHFLTAFLVFGLAVWLTIRAMATPGSRKALRLSVLHLVGILVVQIVLGVEAWMSKFGSYGPYMALPPDMRPITEWSGFIRTGHQLIGTAALATSVVIALRVYRRTPREQSATVSVASSPIETRSRADSLAPASAGA